jgi:hypothetical protein
LAHGMGSLWSSKNTWSKLVTFLIHTLFDVFLCLVHVSFVHSVGLFLYTIRGPVSTKHFINVFVPFNCTVFWWEQSDYCQVQGHICISSKLQYTECRKGLSTSGIKLKISCIQSLFIYFLRKKKIFRIHTLCLRWT